MSTLKTYLRETCPTIYQWLGNAKRWAKPRAPVSVADRHEAIFTKIYSRNAWGDVDSSSGMGSNLEQTETVRRELPILLKQWGIQVFMDAPCGDFFWLKEVDLGVGQYIGVDVVKSLIEKNCELHGGPARMFLAKDISRDELPRADLIFCRDCLGHLSFADIRAVLKNFARTQSIYLLTTTFPKLAQNQNISTGAWRPVNLQISPFHFPAPLLLINENCTELDGDFGDKSLALWRITDLPL